METFEKGNTIEKVNNNLFLFEHNFYVNGIALTKYKEFDNFFLKQWIHRWQVLLSKMRRRILPWQSKF